MTFKKNPRIARRSDVLDIRNAPIENAPTRVHELMIQCPKSIPKSFERESYRLHDP